MHFVSQVDPVTSRSADWDPFAAASEDQIAAGDELRRRCPVAYSNALGWSLFRHGDVMRALESPATFSNAVSAHVSVPNGMDPPQHTRYRRIIDPYFSPQRMQAIEPACRAIAHSLVAALPDGELDVMENFADEFALQAQCAFLGWPLELHRPLRDWVRRNHAAIRSRDRDRMAQVAFEFDQHIRSVLAQRRATASQNDLTRQLLREQVEERDLEDEEIVSILRNWTVGELATISACVGILTAFLAAHPDIQARMREAPALLPRAIDEILRIEGPLMTSRRIAACPIEIHGRSIDAGERITLMWASANRDEQVFEQPEEFRLDRDPALNLLYGAGIHICPGAPLARLELRVLMEELLRAVEILADIRHLPTRALYPAGGFSAVPIQLKRIAAA